MSIIVEDGSVVDGANSYIDVAFADNYFNLRGITEWSDLTGEEKSQALIKSADFIEAVYAQNFKGDKLDPTKFLSFPRANLYINDYLVPEDEIPSNLKNAQCEMALRAGRSEPLIADQDKNVIRERIEGAIDISYDRHSDPATKYSYVSKLLSVLLVSGGQGSLKQVRLVRV
jgi:hypothetical protein